MNVTFNSRWPVLSLEGIPHTNLRVYVAATEAEYFEASADLVPEQVKAAFTAKHGLDDELETA